MSRSKGSVERARPVLRLLLMVVLLGLPAGAARAGGTRSLRQTTAKDFEEGEATASMILPTGEVVPGMKTARIPVDAAFVWCATLSRDGKTAYFGTGDQGRIFAVPTQGGDGDKPRKLADVDAAWVTSLLVRKDGTLLAGSTPGGRIWAINPQTGAVRPFAKLPAEHVWALVEDAKSGLLYAATGGPGKVFVIDAKGTPRQLWDANDKQVVALAEGGGGTLLAGTSDQGIVYRVRADGRAEALHDFEADEVRAVVRTGTTTYLAVNDSDKTGEAPASAAGGPPAAHGTRINPGAGGGAPVTVGGPGRPGQVKSRGAVYRLEDDGQIEQVFALSDSYFTSLLLGEAGAVYAAAGTQGKLYRIAPDRTVALAADLPERQALSLVRTGDGFLVGTGDVGGVYRVRSAGSDEASYLSKVFDAEVPARWGHLRWNGSGGLTFEVRSGNTAKPDRSWTEWRKLEAPTHGGQEGEGRIGNATARYLQYRVALAGKGAVLRETTLFYLPQNQRARITEVTQDTGGGSSAGGGDKSSPPATRTHSSLLKLRWKVENPDADDLIYRLWFRQEGETVWRSLAGPEPLTKPEYDWNTESVPDGLYVVRVWASDERVTPHDRALDSTFDSPPFLVDNTRPEVIDLGSRNGMVTGRARDGASTVSLVEYSLDGNEWRPAAPTDGLLDQRMEAFTLRLPSLSPGPHVVTVRAFDAADNVGSARLTVQIGR
jgi:outer membrane protein assembly factor BamB